MWFIILGIFPLLAGLGHVVSSDEDATRGGFVGLLIGLASVVFGILQQFVF